LLITQGDILFSWSATLDAFIWHGEDAWLNQHIFKVDPSQGVWKKFLYYMLQHVVREILRGDNIHGSTMQHINRGPFLSHYVALPPAPEQERIADRLDELLSDLDAGVAALERTRAKLKLYRASVLKAAVEGTLTADWRARHPHTEPATKLVRRILIERRRRWEEDQLAKFKTRGQLPPRNWKATYHEPAPTDSANLPLLPEGWCWAAWPQIGHSQNGRPFPSREYQHNGIKLLRPGNLYPDGSVGWTERNTRWLPERFGVEEADLIIRGSELVMNLTAQSLKDDFLGRVCITSGEEHCLLNQRLARLTPILSLPKFLLYVFQSSLFRNFVRRLNTGSLIQHMFTSQLEGFQIPLPSLDEQEAIVDAVEDQFSVIDHLETDIEAKLKSAQSLRQSILRHAFTGQLVPQDPTDEPASELLKRIAAERAARTREAAAAKRPAKPASGPRTAKRGRPARRGRPRKVLEPA
jgi:type I restriction enzyme S subunit